MVEYGVPEALGSGKQSHFYPAPERRAGKTEVPLLLLDCEGAGLFSALNRRIKEKQGLGSYVWGERRAGDAFQFKVALFSRGSPHVFSEASELSLFVQRKAFGVRVQVFLAQVKPPTRLT